MNLIYTQNFPVRPETFGTTLVNDIQANCIIQMLNTFTHISMRKNCGKQKFHF